MKIKTAQNQRMLLKLALTPQMRQSIKLLGMSTKDLNEFVDTALEANPFLKKAYEQKRHRSLSPGNTDSSDYISSIRHEENPRYALVSQLNMLGLNGKNLEIAEALIFELDDNGYITTSIDEIASALSVKTDVVEEVLSVIQNMEPAGIGARSIQECLSLQLIRQGKEDSIEYHIVQKHLTGVARDDITRIAKALEQEERSIQKAIESIRRLNPRPAVTLLTKEAIYVIPDIIAITKDDKIELALNREWLPSLEFHNPYEQDVEVSEDSEAEKFIKDNKNAASQLIEHLQKRENTIYRVAEYLLTYQRESFIDDEADIKPLRIDDVARALNLHVSTISRAISNKYIQIDNTVIPMNTLLSHEMKKKDGGVLSKAAVKKRIKILIENEDKVKPLTDEEIKERLEKEHIVITRRTIAKYRTTLKILPTHLRKKIRK